MAVDPTSTANRNHGWCCSVTNEGEPTDAASHHFSAAAPHSYNSNLGKSAHPLCLHVTLICMLHVTLQSIHTIIIIFSDSAFSNIHFEQKHGFKCANKQLVVRRDGLGVVGISAPLSPTNDAKRLKIVKKKSHAQAISLASTSIFSPSSSLISGPGFSSSNVATSAGECKPSGGISDTGMRSRLYLAIEDLNLTRSLFISLFRVSNDVLL